MADLTDSDWSETDASNNAPVPDGFPEGMLPGGVNNSARALMGGVKRWFNRITPVYQAGGGTLNYTLTPDEPLAAYAREIWSWVMPSTNAADATMNISGIGARNIQYFTAGAWTNVPAGYMPIGSIISGVYDVATSKFYILWNSAVGLPASGGTISGNLAVTGTLDVDGAANFDGGVTLTSGDAGAAAAPVLDLYRDSASPAANDEAGIVRWSVEDNAGNKTTVAELVAKLLDATNGSEDASIILRTILGGSLGQEFEIGDGIVFGAATGGRKGNGTANATALYFNGVMQPHKVATLDASGGVAALAFTSFVAGSDYEFKFNRLTPATDGTTFHMDVSLDGGSTWRSTAGDYYYAGDEQYNNATGNRTGSGGSATNFRLSNTTVGNTANYIVNGRLLLVSPDVGNFVGVLWHLSHFNNTGAWANHISSGVFRGTTGVVNGVRFRMASGNIASGDIEVRRIPRA